MWSSFDLQLLRCHKSTLPDCMEHVEEKKEINKSVDYYHRFNLAGNKSECIDRYKSSRQTGQWSIKLTPQA